MNKSVKGTSRPSFTSCSDPIVRSLPRKRPFVAVVEKGWEARPSN